ncbi:Protein of unknown function [Cotesia congregata]|uniref:Uncharacterized protein n=1 Tax=Cotesia congregata TaxID=51543 RepID=A0A8J2HTC3_COTCN|nr:Protein of unknown function [Cotesia congregata]
MSNANQFRHKGKFARKSIVNWKNNVKEIFGAASVFHLKCPKCDRIRQVKSSTSVIQLVVGPAVEVVAKESCHEALKVERELTILNEGSCDRTSTEKTFHDGDSEVNLNSGASDTKTGHLDLKAVSTSTIINPMAERVINTVQTDIMVDTNNNNGAETDFEETNKCCDDSTFDVGSAVINSTGSFIQDESNSKESFASSSQELPKNRKRKLQSFIGTSKTPKTKVGLRLSYDGAWLKKRFRKKKHDCRSNFVGSSKAMEADIAVQILTQNETFVEENIEIKTLIGDEDSCTIANLRRASDHTIGKWTDINHATRKISKLLYAIKKIPKAAIEYLIYCFNSALRANDGNVESTKAAILNIVPHAFGEHDACGLWCNYASDPEGFKHKYLPGGKPLTGDELKASITPIFKQAADNAEKLAPRGSSQINENCNAVITTKAPKAKHYSDSSSSDFRVAAGISQVNLGTSYLNTVNTKLGLSPMKANSLLFRKNRDERRKKRNALIKTKEFNKKRRALFRNRQKSNASAEAREGITYQSNSEISASLELNEKFISSNALTVDGSTKLVIFDIETTGLKLTDQIRRNEKKSFAQSALAEDYLGSTFIQESAHDASADVSVLQQLINHKDINISSKDLMNAGVTVDSILNAKNEKNKLKSLKDSLSALKADKKNEKNKQQCGVSASIITKIAKAGINMCDLKKIYVDDGFEGLKILLSQSIDQKPRVTAIKNKLDELLSSNMQ